MTFTAEIIFGPWAVGMLVEGSISFRTIQSTESAGDPDGYDVFLLVGTSNKIGRYGPIDGVLDATNARIDQYGWDGQVVSLAADPLDHFDENANTVGPGLTFAKLHLATMPSNRKILLVPAGRGGSGIQGGSPAAWWGPAGGGYTGSVTRANAAMAAGSGTNVFRGIIGSFGGADAGLGLTEAQFAGLIDTLIFNLRANITGASQTTPFVTGQSLIGGPNDDANIVAAQTDLPARVSYTGFAPATGFTGGGDNVHFSAAEQRTYAQRYFDSWDVARTDLRTLAISGTPPNASVGIAYAFTPTVRGGVRPYTYSLPSGSIPGVTINSSTGLTGTPTTAGSSSFTIRVTDANGATADLATSITVAVTGAVDTFTAANGTSNNGRAADTGELWTVDGGASYLIDTNRCYAQTVGTGIVNRLAFSGADMRVQADLVYTTQVSNQSSFIALRATGSGNGYGAGYRRSTGTLSIVEWNSGVATFIGSTTAFTPVAGQTYQFRFEAVGTALTLFVDGVSVATVSDATHTTGEVGFYTNAAASTASLGHRWDNFSAELL